jgi:hypothetical protein
MQTLLSARAHVPLTHVESSSHVEAGVASHGCPSATTAGHGPSKGQKPTVHRTRSPQESPEAAQVTAPHVELWLHPRPAAQSLSSRHASPVEPGGEHV